MTFKNIKMWANNPQEARKIMDYMYSLGYEWFTNLSSDRDCEDYQGFFGDTNGTMTHCDIDREYFDCHSYKEVSLPEDQSIKAPPIGLRPKAIVDALRIQEILEAMTRYAVDGQKIPVEWIEELACLNMEK